MNVCTNCTRDVHTATWVIGGLLFCTARCVDGYRLKKQARLISKLRAELAELRGESSELSDDEVEVMF